MEKRNKPAVSRRQLPFEFRMEEREGVKIIRGHGSVFNSLSEDLGGFREMIHTGAFDKALAGSDIRCLINHDPNLILGRNTSGTLRMSINEKGLHYECDTPDTSYGRDLTISMERGDITQSSFAFSMDWKKEGKRDEGGAYEYEYRAASDEWILHIYEVRELFDVSPVTYPAYKAADVRSALSGLQRAQERLNEAQEAAKKAEEAKEQAEKDMEEAGIKRAEQIRELKIKSLTTAV